MEVCLDDIYTETGKRPYAALILLNHQCAQHTLQNPKYPTQ